MPSPRSKYDAVVVGCGVLGLSIANELTRKGLKVAVVGRELPEDVQSTGFASPWAGANWHSFAVNEAERRRDGYTHDQFARLAKEIPHLCERRPYFYYWSEEGNWQEPWYKDLVFGYRLLSPSEVPAPFKFGVTYESYTLNTPLYLQHLAKTLRDSSVPIIRHRLSSLDEAYSLPQIGHVNLVINATGLGARTLLGVEDPLVFPAKGQTVLVRAPDVKECYSHVDKLARPGQSSYIIPRPGPEAHVILGGCFLPNDWSTGPVPEVATMILQEAHKLCPKLDGKGGKGSWKDIEIVSHNVGLRPVREGGLRCEVEERWTGRDRKDLLPKGGKVIDGRKVAVVHAYGIGPAGYQSSLGVAKEVGGLVDGWLKKNGQGKRAKL
ncbi:hypothetical protein CI109_104507 [Kwoniella shandongensis]|uniref:Uncharacterized protein n=1 Tax=Kwoniella shandongensis TaxID=1734106 RepID=A0A5M6BS40_9TREE|nr:uncharacterized protein CI109_006792 [Kwoniella shandongensis]KAA5524842.1 hypothetical protein CI109_006792 [Kwoniella shandongensis]